MSDLKVVPLAPTKPITLRTLDGRYRCITRYRGFILTLVLCAEKLSPSRDYIYIGDFYSDQVSRHWCQVDEIEILEVLAKIDTTPEPAPRWWHRILWWRHV